LTSEFLYKKMISLIKFDPNNSVRLAALKMVIKSLKIGEEGNFFKWIKSNRLEKIKILILKSRDKDKRIRLYSYQCLREIEILKLYKILNEIDQMGHSSIINQLLMKLVIYGLQDEEKIKTISEEIFLDLLTNLPFKPSLILHHF